MKIKLLKDVYSGNSVAYKAGDVIEATPVNGGYKLPESGDYPLHLPYWKENDSFIKIDPPSRGTRLSSWANTTSE